MCPSTSRTRSRWSKTCEPWLNYTAVIIRHRLSRAEVSLPGSMIPKSDRVWCKIVNTKISRREIQTTSPINWAAQGVYQKLQAAREGVAHVAKRVWLARGVTAASAVSVWIWSSLAGLVGPNRRVWCVSVCRQVYKSKFWILKFFCFVLADASGNGSLCNVRARRLGSAASDTDTEAAPGNAQLADGMQRLLWNCTSWLLYQELSGHRGDYQWGSAQ